MNDSTPCGSPHNVLRVQLREGRHGLRDGNAVASLPPSRTGSVPKPNTASWRRIWIWGGRRVRSGCPLRLPCIRCVRLCNAARHIGTWLSGVALCARRMLFATRREASEVTCFHSRPTTTPRSRGSASKTFFKRQENAKGGPVSFIFFYLRKRGNNTRQGSPCWALGVAFLPTKAGWHLRHSNFISAQWWI